MKIRSPIGTGSLVCFVASLALAAPVLAGDEGAKSHEDRFKAMDSNQDGNLTADEHAQAARKMFEEMDANRDGRVTANEMENARDARMARKDAEKMASHEGRYGKGSAKSGSPAGKFSQYDTNNDGVVSESEYQQVSRTMFQKLDTNRDGRLTQDEMRAGHERLTSGKSEKDRM